MPEAKVEAKVAMFTEEKAEELLGDRLDYVLDAIDNIDTKVGPACTPACGANQMHCLPNKLLQPKRRCHAPAAPSLLALSDWHGHTDVSIWSMIHTQHWHLCKHTAPAHPAA